MVVGLTIAVVVEEETVGGVDEVVRSLYIILYRRTALIINTDFLFRTQAEEAVMTTGEVEVEGRSVRNYVRQVKLNMQQRKVKSPAYPQDGVFMFAELRGQADAREDAQPSCSLAKIGSSRMSANAKSHFLHWRARSLCVIS